MTICEHMCSDHIQVKQYRSVHYGVCDEQLGTQARQQAQDSYCMSMYVNVCACMCVDRIIYSSSCVFCNSTVHLLDAISPISRK
jgi:hypothetical protein